MNVASILTLILVVGSPFTHEAPSDYPDPVEGDYVIRNFKFESGEVLPKLKLHYSVIGEPRRDKNGRVGNAVLVMHGTTGSGRGFLSDRFAGQLNDPAALRLAVCVILKVRQEERPAGQRANHIQSDFDVSGLA